jgi:hypothetical protein
MLLTSTRMETMDDERICHECGTVAQPADRYCAECGQPMIEPAATWPRANAIPVQPAFVPLNLPPDTGVPNPPKSTWFGNLLRSRSA